MAVLLIDADIIVYRAAFACESKRYSASKGGEVLFEGDNHKELKSLVEKQGFSIKDFDVTSEADIKPVTTLHVIIDRMLSDIVQETSGSSWEIYLSSSECYRHRLATTTPYKGGRPPKPVHYLEAKRYLLQKYKATLLEDMEADDMLSIRMYELNKDGIPCILVSIDKDLLMVPGTHYNFVKEEWHHVTYETGARSLMTQVLMGDSTDKIPGLPRVGEKAAAKVLKDCLTVEQMRAAVIAKYAMMEEAGKIKPGFLFEQANLVHILPRLSCHLNEKLEVVDGYADEAVKDQPKDEEQKPVNNIADNIEGLEVFTPPTSEDVNDESMPDVGTQANATGGDRGEDTVIHECQRTGPLFQKPPGSSPSMPSIQVREEGRKVCTPITGFRHTQGRY